jgi:hypothetical protein
MARQKNVIPTIEKKLQIAADLCARMELELYSDVEEKIPYGAQSEFINNLIREHYKRIDAVAAAVAPVPAI